MRRLSSLVALLLIVSAGAAYAQRSRVAGTLTADGSVTLDVSTFGQASIDVRGTYAGGGTVNFEVSTNGGDFVTVDCFTPDTPSTAVNSTTSTGLWQCPVSGVRLIRARMSSYATGRADIVISGSAGGMSVVGGATDGQLSAGVGATGDAAATAGSTGSINAKLRLITTDLDAVRSAVQTIDNAISGSGINISQIAGATPASARCSDDSKVVFKDINLAAGTGNTELIAISSTTVIYICAFEVISDGDQALLQWIRGTGTACATGETDMGSYKFSTTIGYGLTQTGGGALLMKTSAGDAFCVERTTSTALMGRLSYVQE